MLNDIIYILKKDQLDGSDLKTLLSVTDAGEKDLIFQKAAEVRKEVVANKIYLRGLIEYSNRCQKNCLYCGIRVTNKEVSRYTVESSQVLECAKQAWENGYGSLVIQSGERTGEGFTAEITKLLTEIKMLTKGELGITLSCGEQSAETYKKWFDAGAHRYLLRFESADPDLYYRIHPNDKLHQFTNRLIALKDLREAGYQVGSGMMIGLPGQTIDHLVEDFLLLKQLDVHMVGMGPYIEHPDTPLYRFRHLLLSKNDRFELSLLAIAVLRIFMKDINIASSTALDTLHAEGREKAVAAGANVLMPNLTPVNYRENYFLYDNKPFLTEADELVHRFQQSELMKNYTLGLNEWGDSKHFLASE